MLTLSLQAFRKLKTVVRSTGPLTDISTRGARGERAHRNKSALETPASMPVAAPTGMLLAEHVKFVLAGQNSALRGASGRTGAF